MTTADFSHEFDILVDSYRRFRDFDQQEPRDTVEFNEYEKSLYLTKAQEDLVKSLYTGKNPYGESFETTEEMRRYLSNLIEEVQLQPITTSNGKQLGIDSKSKFFTLPEDLWFITYEAVNVTGKTCDHSEPMEVVPVRQDEYHKIKKNPFRGANDRRSLRLDLSEGNVEIVSKYDVTTYYVRYLKKVTPIVLELMPEDVSIDGVREETPCMLHESLHRDILERAVIMALQSKGYNISGKTTDNSKKK